MSGRARDNYGRRGRVALLNGTRRAASATLRRVYGDMLIFEGDLSFAEFALSRLFLRLISLSCCPSPSSSYLALSR